MAYSKYIRQHGSLASWLLASVSSLVSRGPIGCMTIACVWKKLHCDFSSSSITRIMLLYDRLKVRKLQHQSMRYYLIDIQTTCDCLTSFGHLIDIVYVISVLIDVKCR